MTIKIRNPWIDEYPDGELSDVEAGGGDYLVETAGYVPKEVQLRNLTQSGEALNRYYEGLYPNYYDPAQAPDDPAYDPTAAKDFDVFAAHDLAIFVQGQTTKAKAEAEEYAKIKSAEGVAPSPGLVDPAPEKAGAGGNKTKLE